jgi:hypothetical protein
VQYVVGGIGCVECVFRELRREQEWVRYPSGLTIVDGGGGCGGGSSVREEDEPYLKVVQLGKRAGESVGDLCLCQ